MRIGDFELNKIYCMNCLDLMKQMPNECIDMIFTDPPYNTGMDKKNTSSESKRFHSKKPRLFGFFDDNLSEEDYDKLVTSCCNEFYRILKQDKCCYIFINWKMLGLWLDRLRGGGFNIKNVIVWDKRVHGLNYQNYAYTYELIIYAVKGSFKLNNHRIDDMREGTFKDVWNIQRKIDNSQEEGHHETKKLIKVVRIPILHSTNEGDLVFDPFAGEGTIPQACKQSNRNFLGSEIEEIYCKTFDKEIKQENIKQWF